MIELHAGDLQVDGIRALGRVWGAALEVASCS